MYTITFEYQGKQYEFLDNFNYKQLHDPDSRIEWMYTEGNYGCDCNRSRFIRQGCDGSFPEMECGREIELLSIKEGERIIWQNQTKTSG